MRFTLIGHSCLFVEHRGVSLLVDPWLFGSVGWRSWWHYPPIGTVDPRWLRPDYLFLTHHHPDHFHYPTLRRIDRATHVFISRFGVDVMRHELARLGFAKVTEVDHGEPAALGGGIEITPHQYGLDDTALVVRCGDTVLLNLNDAKIRGRALDRLLRDIPPPTFLLKAFSLAQAYPLCHTADDPADLELVSRETPMLDFLHTARVVRPKYAVPFSSLVAFLHPESMHANRLAVTPRELSDFVTRSGGIAGTELVTLDPGDGWDETQGFHRRGEDWWSAREQRLERLAADVLPRVARATEEENSRRLAYETFSDYFTGFVRAVPRAVRRFALRRPIAFEIPSSRESYWVIDGAHGRVFRSSSPPETTAAVLRLAEGVLADAIDKKITHFAQGSMRLRTHLRRGGATFDMAFWALVMIWEIGYLPLRKVIGTRLLGVLWRRRHEMLDVAIALLRSGSRLENLGKLFAPLRPAADTVPLSVDTGPSAAPRVESPRGSRARSS